ncbi:PIN domain-containing protein [Burkholderia sp. b13]|nr:PIN domain-containing protein [Burkholderia sp. b13]
MSNKAIVPDANILIRAVLGTRVRELVMVYAHAVQCFAPDVTYTDARKYLPALLEKRGVAPESAIAVLDSLVPLIPIVDAEIYGDTQAAALQRIGQGMPTIGPSWHVLWQSDARFGRRMRISSGRGWRLGRQIESNSI